MFWKKFQISNAFPKTLVLPKPCQTTGIFSFQNQGVCLTVGSAQHVGERDYQEDSYGFSDLADAGCDGSRGICAVLADGMGGLSNGKEVSELAVQSTLEFFRNMSPEKTISQQLQDFVYQLNTQICNRYNTNGVQSGTTLVIAIVVQDTLFWASVGDSRIYLARSDKMYQINEDHDYQNQLLTDYIRGTGSLERAFTDEQKDGLTDYIGSDMLKRIDISQKGFPLQNGDQILLMSDGLYQNMPKQEMLRYLNQPAQSMCDNLVSGVLRKRCPNQDNITVLSIEYRWCSINEEGKIK